MTLRFVCPNCHSQYFSTAIVDGHTRIGKCNGTRFVDGVSTTCDYTWLRDRDDFAVFVRVYASQTEYMADGVAGATS